MNEEKWDLIFENGTKLMFNEPCFLWGRIPGKIMDIRENCGEDYLFVANEHNKELHNRFHFFAGYSSDKRRSWFVNLATDITK